MNIKKSDIFTGDLNCKQISDIKKGYKHFKGFGDVTLYETIHGFIAMFKTGNKTAHELGFWDNDALTITENDFIFLNQNLYRHVTMKQLTITIGIKQ